MRGRERLFATAAIWIAFAFMLNNVVDRFTRVTADFQDLWPNFNIYPGPRMNLTPDDVTRLEEVYQNALQHSQTLMNTVLESVRAQMATNTPILVILSLSLVLAATLSTYFVWRNAHLEAEPAASRRDAKLKRGGRVEQVINALDDDEIAELRVRLAEAASGEEVSLDDLLRR